MLTGLPDALYRHQDVVKLVWRYFHKPDLQTFYYNIIVLPLQSRVSGTNERVSIVIAMPVFVWFYHLWPAGLCVFSWLDSVLSFCPRSHLATCLSQGQRTRCSLCDATHEFRTKWGKDSSTLMTFWTSLRTTEFQLCVFIILQEMLYQTAMKLSNAVSHEMFR